MSEEKYIETRKRNPLTTSEISAQIEARLDGRERERKDVITEALEQMQREYPEVMVSMQKYIESVTDDPEESLKMTSVMAMTYLMLDIEDSKVANQDPWDEI